LSSEFIKVFLSARQPPLPGFSFSLKQADTRFITIHSPESTVHSLLLTLYLFGAVIFLNKIKQV
jgi:hypothetical protein